jgi:hypothetical protein
MVLAGILNKQGHVQVWSVINCFKQFGGCATKRVALVSVCEGPSDPWHLIAHVGTDNVCRHHFVVRVVDTQHGRRRIRNRIVNQFPIIFRHWDESVVVLVERQINRLLHSVHVRQRANVVNSRVDRQFHVPADCQISDGIFQNAKS